MTELKSAEKQSVNQVELPNVDPQITQGESAEHSNASSVEGATDTSSNAFPNLGVLGQISVPVEIVLGTTRMSIKDLLEIGRGAVIQLDRKVGEPIDVMVNDRLVARGELVVIDEETSQFGVKITGIVAPVSIG